MLLNTLIYIACVLAGIAMIKDGIAIINRGNHVFERREKVGLFKTKLKPYEAEGRAAFYFGLSGIVTGGVVYIWFLIAILAQSSLVFGNMVVCMFVMAFFDAIIQSIAVNRNTITPVSDDD